MYINSIMPRCGFRRVSVKRPCPICGKPDWCTVRRDEALAYCMRRDFGSIKQATNGAFVHVLQPHVPHHRTSTKTAIAIGAGETVECIPASAERRDAVYRAMLGSLELCAPHGTHLLNDRGLSDTTIANNLYATTPSRQLAGVLSQELSNRFNLQGVPGFFKEQGIWCLKFLSAGFFVPYRDVDGRISGLQVRLDKGDPRYLWLSSRGKHFGSSPGALLHFNKPDLARSSRSVVITEGALKSDCISEQMERATVAVPGVSSVAPDKLISELRQNLPTLEKVILAFDMDWETNEAVKTALVRLASRLQVENYDVRVWQWNADLGKGLDDALKEN